MATSQPKAEKSFSDLHATVMRPKAGLWSTQGAFFLTGGKVEGVKAEENMLTHAHYKTSAVLSLHSSISASVKNTAFTGDSDASFE